MFSLRPYQQKAVDFAIDMLDKCGNTLIVAGTGAGKTVMMAGVIGKFFDGFRSVHKRSPHILVLVHREEIHHQNKEKFSRVRSDIPTSEITAERKSVKGYVHFGMVQTVSNIFSEFERSKSYFDLIVIDEAHHSAASTYEDILIRNKLGNPSMKILGVTATPNRGDKLPLIQIFSNYYQITTKYLIDSHYLVRPTFLDRTPTFAGGEKGHLLKNIRDDEKGTDLLCGLVDDFLSKIQPGKSIIFAPSHAFCERIYDVLTSKGKACAYLSAGISDNDRSEQLSKFETSECDFLINVDICTEGYDYPPLRNLIEFDTNGTHGMWVQKVGRVLRICEGKTGATVIDYGGNIELYPQGVETSVNLEGAFTKKNGGHLTEEDFFLPEETGPEAEEDVRASDAGEQDYIKSSNDIRKQEDTVYTPYHLPGEFESINDADLGIVFAGCGRKSDFFIVDTGDVYTLFKSDKENLYKDFEGNFDECIKRALSVIGNTGHEPAKPIGKMQIRLLSPEYPTSTLTFYGANCTIAFKCFKDVILENVANTRKLE